MIPVIKKKERTNVICCVLIYFNKFVYVWETIHGQYFYFVYSLANGFQWLVPMAILKRRNVMGIKEKILEIATEAVADREFTHGECVENNKNIADLWTAYSGMPITADEVAIMMVLLKIGRTKSRKAVKDHFVDMAGYAAIAGDIVLGGRPNDNKSILDKG